MMRRDEAACLASGCFMVVCVAVAITCAIWQAMWRADLIARGHAYYDSKTGEFRMVEDGSVRNWEPTDGGSDVQGD